MRSLDDTWLLEPSSRVAIVDGHEWRELNQGWEAAPAAPDSHGGEEQLDVLGWYPAEIPGTAAAVLQRAGVWQLGEHYDFDAEDWWFRTSFDCRAPAAGEEISLQLDGLATVAEVFLNGELVLASESMFATHELDVGNRLLASNTLTIRCRALSPLIEEARRPRARWRTRVAANPNLRFFRTALLGRAPGFAPGPATVGPYRPVRLLRRRRLVVEEVAMRPRLEHERGVIEVDVRLRSLTDDAVSAVEVECEGPLGVARTSLALSRGAGRSSWRAKGRLAVPGVSPWWPHTHGEPTLYRVRLRVRHSDAVVSVDLGATGFRELRAGADPSREVDVEREGLHLHINGVPVFARGAVWTPIDSVGMAPSTDALRGALERVRDGGMNMLRIPGTGCYESAAFHDLCDELGI
ncbi:MAG TPA: hypothetical protein VKG38_11880, partial [Solirubrobacteraceae bacterium]|nr:hypothetical protein [Solirubrobacteraceae bacterium]